MTHRISFFPYSEWDSDRGCVAFIALVDGVRARCLIQADALKELAPEISQSWIRVFSEYRQDVEELARELIQRDRLEGRELVIRLGDVQIFRKSPLVELAAPSSSSMTPSRVDGRSMTMSAASRDEIWQSLCERQRVAFQSALLKPVGAAQEQLDEFVGRAVPETAHELNLRRVTGGRLAASWKAGMTS